MKLLIDGASCMGHGRCYQIVPDVVIYDDEGFPMICDEPIAVPDDQSLAAEDAAATCPEQAITLIPG